MLFLGSSKKPRISVVRMTGVIAQGDDTINDERFKAPLTKAFNYANKHGCVAIVLNTPGGAPGQSELIATRIRDLSDAYEVPTIAFIEDAAASGGCWISCAADEIYCLNSSIVGSIGVIGGVPNFYELMKKHGIEYLQLQAGENKAPISPFTKVEDGAIKKVEKQQLQPLHQVFQDWVIERRGDKLPQNPSEVFSARVWIGKRALAEQTGLVDGIATLDQYIDEEFGSEKYTIKEFAPKSKRNLFPALPFSSSTREERETRAIKTTVDQLAARLGIPEHPFDMR